jgi:hypothetical protein
MKLRHRAIGKPKKDELIQDKSVPSDPNVVWTDLMTIPLKKQTPPKWDASAKLAGGKLAIVAQRGDLPDDAKLGYRIDSGKYLDMHAKGDAWTSTRPRRT